MVVTDFGRHTIHRVIKSGTVVSTLVGNGEAGFADGTGADTSFNIPYNVVVTT